MSQSPVKYKTKDGYLTREQYFALYGNDRHERGRRIANTHAEVVTDIPNIRYMVYSQTQRHTRKSAPHIVTFQPNLRCTCKDFFENNRKCKHINAVLLTIESSDSFF